MDQTDPSDSYDENGKTVFTVTTDPAKPDMSVGLEFNLETVQHVEKVYFRTTTPGITVEVYGAKDKLPPDILDTRWKHLGTRKAARDRQGLRRAREAPRSSPASTATSSSGSPTPASGRRPGPHGRHLRSQDPRLRCPAPRR